MLMRKPRGWRNRAGSVRAEPNHYSYPVSFEEIQSEVLRAAEEGQRLRVAGSGRAFSPLCWTDENLMSLVRYEGIERWSSDRSRVWVRSGTRMGALADELAHHGLALENWQGPRSQSLGGAVNAGAFSSSLEFPGLAAQACGVHMVCADGSARTFNADNNPKMLDAVRLSLGALGVITHVELRCVPAYRLRSRSETLSLDHALDDLPRQLQLHRGYSFRWFPYTGTVQTQAWLATESPATPWRPLRELRRNAMGDAQRWIIEQASQRVPAAARRLQQLAPAVTMPADSVVEARHAMSAPPRLPYREIEHVLPLEQLGSALARMERVIRALNYSAHLPVEVRFAGGDDLWLSPTQGRDSACIAVRVPQAIAHEDYFSAMAEIAELHDGRPSWTGMHARTARDLAPLYPRFEDFLQLRHQLDPRGVFLNPHLSSLFGIRSS